MRPRTNILGQKFDRLTVKEDLGVKNHTRTWKTQCECGNFRVCSTAQLVHGRIIRECSACAEKRKKENRAKLSAKWY